MVAFFTSRPRKQSCLRESQYLCITFIEGKLKHVRLQTKMLTLDARAARMHKTTWFPHFYDVADVKQCFHRSCRDCDLCLSMISDKRQMTVSQSVYIVVKKYILIIKDLIKNCCNFCVSCAIGQKIFAFIPVFLKFTVWQVWKYLSCAVTAHIQFFQH